MNTPHTDNPLLRDAELTPFDQIRPDHVGPALDVLLADAEAALERAVGPDVPADHDALALLLDVPVERLRRAWAHVNHLSAVADSPALRAAHAEAQPRIVAFTTRLGADHRLYAKYKAVAALQESSPATARLTAAQRKALADTLRDFVLCRVPRASATPPSRTAAPNSRASSATVRSTPPTPSNWWWTKAAWPVCPRTCARWRGKQPARHRPPPGRPIAC